MTTLNLSLYLISAILIILALRGLSSPQSSRRGNYFGMLGMTIAVITTLSMNLNYIFSLIAISILAGGTIGLVIAKKSPYDQDARTGCPNAFFCWVSSHAHRICLNL